MEAAKLAVAEFTARRGHTTEVHETVLPAVTLQTVKPTRHEIITEAVDREVHQHHYHTTVQPISHIEELPARHVHNLVPVTHTHHEHDNIESTKARVAAELVAFKNSKTILPTTHTNSILPTAIGEHHHHHVYEVVQPVIYKEVHTREVVHTTLPLHETHYYEPIHHGISALAAKPIVEFTKMGGVLTGSKSPNHETYEGTPRPYLKELSTSIEKLGILNVNHTPRNKTSTTTTTSTTTSVSHRPTPINTSAPAVRNTSVVTPTRTAAAQDYSSPRSSTSSNSSASMPSTPTNQKYMDNVPIRNSESGMSPQMVPQRNSMEGKNANGGFLGRIRSSHKAQPITTARY